MSITRHPAWRNAEAGDPDALYLLASYAMKSKALGSDLDSCINMLEDKFEVIDADTWYNLAMLLRRQPNVERAVEILRGNIERGHALSFHGIGKCYHSMEGEESKEKAMKFYRIAADDGQIFLKETY